MPTYEYRCESCGVFEVQQRITEDPLDDCPTCGGAVSRLISRNVNIVFKGPGFHITDYRSKSYEKAAASEGGSEGSGSSSEASSASTTES